jgi:hypothetical protein
MWKQEKTGQPSDKKVKAGWEKGVIIIHRNTEHNFRDTHM